MKGEQGSATSIRREREGQRDGKRERERESESKREREREREIENEGESQWLWVEVVMLHHFRLASAMDQEPCWVQAITGRSKDAHHMGGNVKTSVNGFALPNVVSNNTCVDQKQKGDARWPSLGGGCFTGGGGGQWGEGPSWEGPRSLWLST